MKHKFIAVCREMDLVTGYKQIWQSEVKESLEEIVENFLQTGKLEYTKLPDMNKLEKEEKVSEKIYPEIDKLILWETTGRFRKRPDDVGGNIRETYMDKGIQAKVA